MTSITRWEPRREFLSLRDAMDRLFEDSFVRSFNGWPFVGNEASLTVDMVEAENEIVVKAAVPGVKADEIDITVTGDVLTIKGETKEDKDRKEGNYHYREWKYGAFERSLTLPASVNVEGATAEFENGVLTLTLPKSETAKPTKLQIKSK